MDEWRSNFWNSGLGYTSLGSVHPELIYTGVLYRAALETRVGERSIKIYYPVLSKQAGRACFLAQRTRFRVLPYLTFVGGVSVGGC
jgi:hypothetical protein